MNILLIGSGGREHALAWKIAQSVQCDQLFISPGSDAMNAHGRSVALATAQEAASFCNKQNIALAVIGPEQPLVDGWADVLRDAGVAVFGPNKEAAQIEGSKAYMKDFCAKHGVKTAAYESFTDEAAALAYAQQLGAPLVVKTDGLAAGKGVTVAMDLATAEQAIKEAFSGKFGAAGQKLVIEEFLDGEEVSYFIMVNDHGAVAFGSAQDHKRAYDGDTGPNTGGMGTYSPAPIFTPAIEQQVQEDIVTPTLNGLKSDKLDFRGVLFAGLMLTAKGTYLLEYNIRFGDPEAQVVMPRLKSDLVTALLACAKNEPIPEAEWHPHAALCVVMATEGYPGSYPKHTPISGLNVASQLDGVTVFHAGTEQSDTGWVSTGGRVLGVTGQAPTLEQAQQRAYHAVSRIQWEQGFYRKDIGWRALKSEAA